MRKITVSLPDEVATMLYAIVDKGNRSNFIAHAIEDAIERKQAQAAVQAIHRFIPIKVEQEGAESIRESYGKTRS